MEDAFFTFFGVVFSKVHIFGVHTFSKKLETRFSALKFFGCNLFKLSVALKYTRHIMMILKPKFQHYASTFQFKKESLGKDKQMKGKKRYYDFHSKMFIF